VAFFGSFLRVEAVKRPRNHRPKSPLRSRGRLGETAVAAGSVVLLRMGGGVDVKKGKRRAFYGHVILY